MSIYLKVRNITQVILGRTVFVCLLGISGPVFCGDFNNPLGEELLLVGAFSGASSAVTGVERVFPDISESGRGDVEFSMQVTGSSGEESTAQQQFQGSFLWLVLASVLGFSVVARRRSADQRF